MSAKAEFVCKVVAVLGILVLATVGTLKEWDDDKRRKEHGDWR